ncbi:hypothetical protein ACIP10_30920 [Streptomyces galbus]|uniref:hypothetical protein n=1 Tax=Streptomyces galbus TaxID=33898 RepID=UPI00382DA3EF
MTTSVPGSGTGPDGKFTPVYTPPSWYADNPSPQDSVPRPPAWTMPSDLPAAPPAGCKVCGVTPTAPVTVRAHQGFIFAMRWQRIDGPLCRLCGIALVRDMTTKTLWQGWWGVGSLVFGTPFALVSNLLAYRKLRQLQPSVPVHGRRQVPLGAPILRRPLAYVALAPLIWAAVVLFHVVTSAF